MARAKAKAAPPPAWRLQEILGGYRYNQANERDLQDGIAQVLALRGIRFDREVRLDVGDIPDFMVGGTAVEVKVEGSPAVILRQLARYAAVPRVKALLLVTRKEQHAHRFPVEVGGKPLYVLTLGASAL